MFLSKELVVDFEGLLVLQLGEVVLALKFTSASPVRFSAVSMLGAAFGGRNFNTSS